MAGKATPPPPHPSPPPSHHNRHEKSFYPAIASASLAISRRLSQPNDARRRSKATWRSDVLKLKSHQNFSQPKSEMTWKLSESCRQQRQEPWIFRQIEMHWGMTWHQDVKQDRHSTMDVRQHRTLRVACHFLHRSIDWSLLPSPQLIASAFQVGPRFGSAASSLASCFH